MCDTIRKPQPIHRSCRGPSENPRLCAPRVTLASSLALLADATAMAMLAGEPINLSQTPGYSANPASASAGERTMVVWEEDDDVWYALRSQGAWSAAAPVPRAIGAQPAISGAPDGGFELVWSQVFDTDRNEDIYFVDPAARPPAATPSIRTPTATVAGPGMETPTPWPATAMPARWVIYLPVTAAQDETS